MTEVISESLAMLGRYPFLPAAGQLVHNFVLSDLEGPEMTHLIERAARRVATALDGNTFYDVMEDPTLEVLSFVICLVILKALNMRPATNRFTLAEARRIEHFLKQDWTREKDVEKKGDILKMIFAQACGVAVVIDGPHFKLSIPAYLKLATKFHDKHWNLVARKVESRFVLLDGDTTVRLARDALRKQIDNRILGVTLQSVPEPVKAVVDALRTKYAAKFPEYTILSTGEWPPCVKFCIETLNRGENLPHSGRVLLASYMINIGKPVDEIVTLFVNAPDYKEQTTRKQIEFLAGLSGKGIKYATSGCQKVAGMNLCFPDANCTGLINPIQYGRTSIKK